jgi:hypothetical protein
MLSAKPSRIGCEPNRTGYELNKISRTASEPSRRSPYTAAIGESASTRPACITEMLEELCTQKYVGMENAEYDLEEHRLVSALAMRCKPFKLFDSLRERCLTTAARKPSILVEQVPLLTLSGPLN